MAVSILIAGKPRRCRKLDAAEIKAVGDVDSSGRRVLSGLGKPVNREEVYRPITPAMRRGARGQVQRSIR